MNEIKTEIIDNGGKIIFEKDNIIIASEVSEGEYRRLLENGDIERVDVLPLKRFGYDSETYQNMTNEGLWLY